MKKILSIASIWYPAALGLLFYPLSILVHKQLISGKIETADAMMIGIHYISISTYAIWGELPLIALNYGKRNWVNIFKIVVSIFLYHICANLVVGNDLDPMLSTFFEFLIFTVTALILAFASILTAYLVRKIFHSSNGLCNRYLESWKSIRVFRNRILFLAICMTLALATAKIVVGVVQTHHLRNSIRDADHLIVRTGHHFTKVKEYESILFETADKNTLINLSDQITFPPEQFGSSFVIIIGSPDIIFDLYKDGYHSESFGLYGSNLLDSEQRDGLAEVSPLTSLKISRWLIETGIQEQLDEFRKRE